MTYSDAFARALHEIDWEFEEPAPALRCPITGKVVLVGIDPVDGSFVDDIDEPEWEEIPTALFSFVSEVGEFNFLHKDLEHKIIEKRRELGEEAEDMDDFEILSEHLETIGNAPLIYSLTVSGFACGPISSTCIVGLDLAPDVEKQA
ncbi:hypothetical protein LZA78_03855 [Sinirhodobacter sp. WL0062]|uniref:Uncharacterized protein n=1 Tax=Rhodobacter flavimaris TaxID=2907145 RepID=A0ABS8YTL7_9RHOB|nr:hypothetical protein [Sinirhodobacter sp. WL0062]MCE5972610.1 hypothetical protein [Sinirhodobacter sp. WL0062]